MDSIVFVMISFLQMVRESIKVIVITILSDGKQGMTRLSMSRQATLDYAYYANEYLVS